MVDLLHLESPSAPKSFAHVGISVLALDFLHTRSPPILFRDLKPENILICGDTGYGHHAHANAEDEDEALARYMAEGEAVALKPFKDYVRATYSVRWTT